MLNRVKQFVTAVTAKITRDDQAFIARFLSSDEQKLFWHMNLPEQRHALDVAYTADQLAGEWSGTDRQLLIKAALLHDVGKIQGDISIADKVVTVLADTLCPRVAKRTAREGRGNKIRNLRHAFYVYYNHAARGADMIAAAQSPGTVSNLVRRHHEPVSDEDPIELRLLKMADSLN